MNSKNNYSPGYLDITMRQFYKNKLAVFGAFTILFLFFVAVYAPLLANDKPLLIYGPFIDSYEDTFYALSSNIALYISKKDITQKEPTLDNQAEAQKYHTFIYNSFKRLKPHIPLAKKKTFKKLKNALFLSLNPLDEDITIQLMNRFQEEFNPETINLRYRLLSPAIRNLSSLEIFLMVLYPLLLIFVLLKNKLKRVQKRISCKKEIIICILTAVCCALIWDIMFLSIFDPTDYKQLAIELPSDGWATFAPVPFGENENIISESKQKPSWLLKTTAENSNFHLLGTDTNGRDVLARMIYGTRISMSVGFIAIGICLIIGILFGALAGYFRGWTDITLSRLIEIVICFPTFFLILTVLAFLRPSILNIMIVIGLTGWTGIARLCRGEFLKLVTQDFVTAAHALGTSNFRIIFKHILPNGLGPVLVSVSFGVAGAILTESALSFLGFGVPQPTASWGDLLNNGRNDIQGTWWLTVFPGLAIFCAVTAFNLAGEGLRDALDPRLKS